MWAVRPARLQGARSTYLTTSTRGARRKVRRATWHARQRSLTRLQGYVDTCRRTVPPRLRGACVWLCGAALGGPVPIPSCSCFIDVLHSYHVGISSGPAPRPRVQRVAVVGSADYNSDSFERNIEVTKMQDRSSNAVNREPSMLDHEKNCVFETSGPRPTRTAGPRRGTSSGRRCWVSPRQWSMLHGLACAGTEQRARHPLHMGRDGPPLLARTPAHSP